VVAYQQKSRDTKGTGVLDKGVSEAVRSVVEKYEFKN
jgi:hypothetical protein